MTPTTHHRCISGIEIREAPKGSGSIGVLVGHAAVFNSPSLPFDGAGKPWVEKIAPGAFTRSLRENPDVLALWSHDMSVPIARTPNTLKLREDERGLHAEVQLIDTTACRDALASVRAGIVRAWSFGFAAKKARWIKGETQDVRVLEDVDLFEVSPVASPAYPGTDLSARGASLYVRNGGNAADEIRALAAERDEFLRSEEPGIILRDVLAMRLRLL